MDRKLRNLLFSIGKATTSIFPLIRVSVQPSSATPCSGVNAVAAIGNGTSSARNSSLHGLHLPFSMFAQPDLSSTPRVSHRCTLGNRLTYYLIHEQHRGIS